MPGMTGAHANHAQLLVEMGVSELPFLGWSQTSIFSISALQVVGIADVSHQHQASAFLSFFFFFFFFVVLGFELKAYTLSHCHFISPFFVMDFFKLGSSKLFAWLALNCDLLDVCLLSSQITGISHQCPTCICF
jgi:hypothetical protein